LAKGQNVPADVDKGLALIQEVAESGNANALYQLGDLYTRGGAVPVNGQKAIDFLQRAADEGNISAYIRLGELYRDGTVVPADGTKATELFQKAVEAGSKSSFTSLADAALQGIGQPRDVDRAIDLLEQGIAMGDLNATLKLATVLYNGEYVATDKERALQLYEDAATKGSMAARYQLAIINRDGGKGIPRNPQRALALLKQNVLAGHGLSMLALADGHLNKRFGSLSDTTLGVITLRKAEELGVEGAAPALADAYMSGRGGLPKAPQMAIKLLTDAAEAGNRQAARALVTLYRNGRGEVVRKSPATAARLIDRYAAAYDPNSLMQEKVLIEAAAAADSKAFAAVSKRIWDAPAPLQLGMLNSLRWANENAFVYALQDKMKVAGLYKGPLNGLLTSSTIRALSTLCDQGPAGDRCRLGPLSNSAARVLAIQAQSLDM
ncbi:tetratricopeptide repeat protein, partial [Pleomorphomonas sp. NRK KF1]|uniref:tetratricopeptide repeat protein n=1 Tax=Pleomorphomonas sp. NRK KF1 TaxID=2943000 RepID=UPI0020449ADA